MWAKIALAAAGILYRNGGRKLVKAKVDDPRHEWDDVALKALDVVFGYGGSDDGANQQQ